MISVIIPTYNEADVIKDCLDSLASQSHREFEVIVVDDGSTDSTMEVLSKYKSNNLKLTVLKGLHKGAGSARNLGSSKAKGEILVFVDSDMTFDENFLANLTKPIVEGKTKGTFSKDEYLSNWDNVWSKCWNKNEGWEDKKRHPKEYPDRQKVFRAILKKEFDKVGGFTAGGYNDDWSLSEKLGYEADVAKNAIFYHRNPSTLNEVFYHAMWVGKRDYKFGVLGFIVALLRSSLPVSIIMGTHGSVVYMLPQFIVFKVIYDFGIFNGILKYIFTKKGSK